MYRVVQTDEADAEVGRLAPEPRRNYRRAVRELRRDPRGGNAKKLDDYETLWRIPIGGWRIVYDLDLAERVVTILRVGRRRTVYDDLDDLERRSPRSQ